MCKQTCTVVLQAVIHSAGLTKGSCTDRSRAGLVQDGAKPTEGWRWQQMICFRGISEGPSQPRPEGNSLQKNLVQEILSGILAQPKEVGQGKP